MKHRTVAASPYEPSQPGAHRRPAVRGPRRLMGLVAALTLLLGGGLAMAMPAAAGPTDPITMPDDNLRACINTALGQGDSDPITEAQAAGITEVDCPSMGITDITGLETMSNLTEVRLFNNSISDISPLSGLTNLTQLYLITNSITDVSALSGLTNLTQLYLSGNSITDISPLSGLTDLTSLYSANNSITDISALSGLQNLNFLLVGNNNIADLSPVAGLSTLRSLHAEANEITDISVLSSLTSLTSLWLQSNGITNISPLAGMTNLTNLRVEDQSTSHARSGRIPLHLEGPRRQQRVKSPDTTNGGGDELKERMSRNAHDCAAYDGPASIFQPPTDITFQSVE